MHASAECMLYEDTDSTILLRRTQTPELLQPRDPPWPWLTLNAARRSFQHGGLPQRQSCCSLVTHHGLGSRSMPREEASSMEGYHNASAASNASTLRWPASTLPTVATSGTKFSECINTSVACIYFQVQFSECINTSVACIYFQVQTVATSSAKFSERIHVRHVRYATATSPYVVLPAEATSTRLPPAPGQELRRHVPQLQVDSDAADIHNPTSFLPRSIYLRYLFPPPPLPVFIDSCGSVLYR
jgi:hypothetical protein